jgi:hypothetical protein
MGIFRLRQYPGIKFQNADFSIENGGVRGIHRRLSSNFALYLTNVSFLFHTISTLIYWFFALFKVIAV